MWDVGRQADFEELVTVLFDDTFFTGQRKIDRLVGELAIEAAQKHRFSLQLGAPLGLQEIVHRARIAPSARHLVRQLLRILVEDGHLSETGGRYQLSSPFRPATFDEALEDATATLGPEPMLALLQRCRERILPFLHADARGIDIIFPNGDLSTWRDLHNSSRFIRPYPILAAFAADAALPLQGTLVELGAGTGAAAQCLLERRDPATIGQYHYTDVSHVFLAVGKEQHADIACMTYGYYDLNRIGPAQGVAESSVDVVLAVNTMHVARDLLASACMLRDVIRPGGWLILGEGSPPGYGRIWRPEVILSFLTGWWNVDLDAEFRPEPGFLCQSHWQLLLSRAGFKPVHALPEAPAADGRAYGGLVAAQRSP